MTDPSIETNRFATKLTDVKSIGGPQLARAIALNPSLNSILNRSKPGKVSPFRAEPGSQLICQTSNPAGILVEIMVSQALTVVLAGLVVAAILH